MKTQNQKNSTNRGTKIAFWATTVIIFLMEGVIPALTSQTELAKQGVQHLGYPLYFGNAFVIFKVLGTLALIIPKVPARIKEWAYAGFAFDFIFASISHAAVDGVNFQSFFPIIFLVLLVISYVSYHKLNNNKSAIADSPAYNGQEIKFA